MNDATRRLVLLVLALLAGSLGLSFGARAPRALDLFPTPSEGLTIAAMDVERRSGPALSDLLREFGEVTGEHVIVTAETAGLLKNVRVGIDRGLEVPAEEVYEVVETLLIHHRFVLIDLRREEPRMMGIFSLDSAMRANLKATARYVPETELPIYAEHPAILITTAIRLEYIDVRTLTNAMRGLTTDPNTFSVVPIPEAESIILTGFGTKVIETVAMLREMNDAAGANRAEHEDGDEEEAR